MQRCEFLRRQETGNREAACVRRSSRKGDNWASGREIFHSKRKEGQPNSELKLLRIAQHPREEVNSLQKIAT